MKLKLEPVRVDETGARIVDLDKKCETCSGLLDVEPAPVHAAGCVCAHLRSDVKAHKQAVQAMMDAPTVDARTAARLASGAWSPKK